MLDRSRVFAGLVALAAAASLALAQPAHAAKGQWSIGGNFGVGLYSNTAVNDSVDAAGDLLNATFEHVKDGWEYGGSIRYGISPKASLDYEVDLLNGKKTTGAQTNAAETTVKTTAVAGPLSLYYELGSSDKSIFNFFIGVGPMYSAKVKADGGSGASAFTFESDSKTGLYAHAGFEGDYMVSKSFAITARALGRYAKATDVPYTNPINGEPGKVDVNLSGGAFSLGLRAFFGKY